eukprot:4513821-Prymnesium_polylepis.2
MQDCRAADNHPGHSAPAKSFHDREPRCFVLVPIGSARVCGERHCASVLCRPMPCECVLRACLCVGSVL